jgi:leucyl aminopeptidase
LVGSLSDIPFTHWDIAGVMNASKTRGWMPSKGMSGLPTRALMRYVELAAKQ